MLDLESEVMRGPGSIPSGSNILSLNFFHIVKPPMPILALLLILCVCENSERTLKYLNAIKAYEVKVGCKLFK